MNFKEFWNNYKKIILIFVTIFIVFHVGVLLLYIFSDSIFDWLRSDSTMFSDDSFVTILIIVTLILSIIPLVAFIVECDKRRKEFEEAIDRLLNESAEITPEEFMRIRTAKVHGGKYEPYISSSRNFAGVYILHNQDRDKYYVGQSKTVFNRVNNHFTGKGNGDVYVDYRNGEHFTIKLIPLMNSGFDSLDSLERYFISYYHAFENGYNKTRGNR
ncbi:MAG: GIY-YIG nuclease family protein [Ruminococcus sp.]|nr:GIY-YIG nuclease family protein [Ruminococcus sp.]MBP3267527.1 GIY-YIG nuclease family protein [Ruminococcus sp.]